MSIADFPGMLVSETRGWNDVEHAHRPANWYRTRIVLPLALLPPAMYVYAERAHPGVILPASIPALTMTELLVTAAVFYLAQIVMINYMAMVIQREAIARDHDPGYDGAYSLAAIAPIPLWIGSLALAVPSLVFSVLVGLAALVATVVLIRHGTRPLLRIPDEKKAHYIADVVTMVGVAAWIGLMLVSGMLLGVLLSARFV